MVTVRELLRAYFNSNRRKLATSHSTCVIRKKAHSLEQPAQAGRVSFYLRKLKKGSLPGLVWE
jgi:hypothetical protein